ncbi:hypothetical protein [Lacticaseibacillus parakribbianus]|uniref:hypothetical protein n=1 Tax=Lacticaseibacillus parakribbianus TaxID=2970927 RepID=UPI0021CB29BE|nr:hypothetical protein [Lacticaseibacillus parakribbianus]
MAEDETIGAFFRKARQGQHITLAQAAGAGGSAAGLSRFERGATDLSVASATVVMHNLILDAHDLMYWQDRQKGSWPLAVPSLLNQVAAARLTLLLTRYLAAHQADRGTVLQAAARLVVEYGSQPAANRELTPASEQLVADLLRYPDSWNTLQTSLLIAVTPFASSELLGLLLPRLAALGQAQLGQPRWGLRQRLDALGWAIIASNDAVVAQQEEDRVPANVNWQCECLVLRRGVAWAKDPSAANAAVLTRTLALTDKYAHAPVGNRARLLMQARVACKRPHHNPDLRDTPVDAALVFDGRRSFTDGPQLGVLRRRLGLTLSQAAVAWSSSTQSRFENGESALGFGRVLALYQRLGQSDLFTNWLESPLNRHVRLQNELQEVRVHPQRFAAPDAAALIHKVAEHDTGMPTWMTLIEQEGVRQVFVNEGILPATPADPVMVRAVLSGTAAVTFWPDNVAKAMNDFIYNAGSLTQIESVYRRTVLSERTTGANMMAFDWSNYAKFIGDNRDAAFARRMQNDMAQRPLTDMFLNPGASYEVAKLILAYTVAPSQRVIDALVALVADMRFLGNTFRAEFYPEWLVSVGIPASAWR